MITDVSTAKELELKELHATILVNYDESNINIMPVVTWLQRHAPDESMYRYHLKVYQNNHSNRSVSTQSGVISWGYIGKEIKLSQVSHNINTNTVYKVNLVIFKNRQAILEVDKVIDLSL